jgi:hypothetical protein
MNRRLSIKRVYLRACIFTVVGGGIEKAMVDPGDRVECLNVGVGSVVMSVVVVIARAVYSHKVWCRYSTIHSQRSRGHSRVQEMG